MSCNSGMITNSALVSILAIASCLPLQGCWLAVVGAGAEAGYVVAQEERTAEETLKDQYLVTAVKSALAAKLGTTAFDINVDSFKAVVTLRGALTNQEEIDRAVSVAESVNGVASVTSKLVLVQ